MIKDNIFQMYYKMSAREKILFFIALFCVILFISIEVLSHNLRATNLALRQELTSIKEHNKMIDLLKDKTQEKSTQIEQIKNLKSYQIDKMSYILDITKNINIHKINKTNTSYILQGNAKFDDMWNMLDNISINRFLVIEDIMIDENLYFKISVKNVLL